VDEALTRSKTLTTDGKVHRGKPQRKVLLALPLWLSSVKPCALCG
jgi:hypothetical protein